MGFQRQAEGREAGVSYSIYELKSYNEISTAYIREGETRGDDQEGGRAAYSTKAKLRMSKYLLRRDRGRVGPGIMSRIDRFSLGPIGGGFQRGGVTILEGSKVLARGTRSCT